MIDNLVQDLRYGIRALMGRPAFSLIAILTLALGIGANSAIFSVVNAVLLRPLPYEDPSHLMLVWNQFKGVGLDRMAISEPELVELHQKNEVFENLAAYTYSTSYNLAGARPERLRGIQVSQSFFDVMGVKPLVGRTFRPEDDHPGHNAVVLSNDLWHQQWGGDPSIIGKTVSLNDKSYEVLGVMPPGFRFPDEPELWSLLTLDPSHLQPRGYHYLRLVGRTRSDLSLQQAQLGMESSVVRYLHDTYPGEYPGGGDYTMRLVPLREETIGDIRPTLLLLLGTVALVLLIASGNLANLLLVRAQNRERELAVRTVMGANRTRLFRQMLSESVLLSLLGGAIGLGIGIWGTRLLVAINAEDIPRSSEIGVDTHVLLFTLLISVGTGILFGMFPAFHAFRQDLSGALGDGGGGGARLGGHRIRNALAVVEIALALVLLIGAGLVIKSFVRMQEVDPGFQTDHLLTMRVSLSNSRYPDDRQIQDFYDQILQRLRGLAGVKAAGAISSLPLSGSNTSGNFGIEGKTFPVGTPLPEADTRSVTPGYFRAMGIPVVSGRTFTSQDQPVEGRGGIVIVDESLADKFWPGKNPLQEGVRPGGDRHLPYRPIIGVVRHVKHHGLAVDSRMEVYFPLTQRPVRSMFLVLKTDIDPESLIQPARNAIWQVDPAEPVYDIMTMTERLHASLARQRFATLLLSIFAAVAVLLAVIGVYGVMMFTVTQRTRELGVRIALGAKRQQVLALVLKQGLNLTLIGVALGLLGAFALTRLVSSLLFQVGTIDILTFTLVSFLLAVIGLIACTVPAGRAARVDPAAVLKQE